MSDANACPSNEGHWTRNGDDILEYLARSARDVDKGQQTHGVGHDRSPDWNAPEGGPKEEFWCATQTSQCIERARGDVDGRVDGGESGREDEDVDQIWAVAPTGVLKGDSKR